MLQQNQNQAGCKFLTVKSKWLLAAALLLFAACVQAKNAQNSADSASAGLESIAQGVKSAILLLGRQDGFFGDQAVKILLPTRLQKLAGTARKLGALLGGEAPDLDARVTEKAMDGLYFYVTQKERDIRKNPLQQGSDLLRAAFSRKYR